MLDKSRKRKLFNNIGKVSSDVDAELYRPKHFLRCHSKQNDPVDVQTQVWQCAFEPDPNNPSADTGIVATCGGNSVCLVEAAIGKVVMKYNHSDTRILLYSLAWSTLHLDDIGIRRINVLAVGGSRGTVLLLDPSNRVCYCSYQLCGKHKTVTVETLLFSPQNPQVLICGRNDGKISVLDIGIPKHPSYEGVPTLLATLDVEAEIFSLAFSSKMDTLLVGCDSGLSFFSVSRRWEKCDGNLKPTKFKLPTKCVASRSNVTLVDSVVMITEHIVATKYALHGCIYVWDLEKSLTQPSSPKKGNVEMYLVATLKWSDTDNYFMGMAYNKASNLLVCGDDKGSLWMYDLKKALQEQTRGTPSSPSLRREPTAVVPWPETEDEHLEKTRKLKLETYDIVIDKVCIDTDARHVVAVTSNNVVCVWTKEECNSDTD